MRAWVVGAVLAGCGRVEFGPLTDASDADSAASDDVAPFVACRPEYLLCDTFESDTLATFWTTGGTGGGTATIDGAVSNRGSRSVRFSMPTSAAGVDAGIYLANNGSFITTATSLWTRVFVRINALPVNTNALELISLQRSASSGNFVFVRSTQLQLYSQFDGKQAGTGQPIPVNTWVCLVWKLTFATTPTGVSTLTSDALPFVVLDDTITQADPIVDELTLGTYFAPTNIDDVQPAFDLWADDLIVDDEVISCAQ